MLISNISSNTKTNFQGIFKIVKTKGMADTYEKEEITNYHAIYHPYKNETKTQIKKAMDEFVAQSKCIEEEREDGGIDRKTGKHIKHIWHVTKNYTCTRGRRLNSPGEGVSIIG